MPRSPSAAVDEYLSARSWPWELEQDTGAFRFTAELDNGIGLPMVILPFDGDGQLLVYSLVPFLAPEDQRDPMARLMARINFTLVVGSFEVDPDEGELRFRTSIDVADAEITDGLIDQLVLANVVQCSHRLVALAQVCDGVDPDEAFRQLP